MIPAAFDYKVAESTEQEIALLGEYGDEAKLLAGGHSLIPMMKFRLAAPAVLIDIARISDLSYIREADGHLAIGAMTKHVEVETSDVVAQHAPMLAHVAALVGDPAVRHRGTLGGTLAHSDPASDLPAAVLALGGTIIAHGPNGAREIAANEFFTGYFESVLAADEIITEVQIPTGTGAWN
jgi:carbon-monoxide dehydrogenase medium subunit